MIFLPIDCVEGMTWLGRIAKCRSKNIVPRFMAVDFAIETKLL